MQLRVAIFRFGSSKSAMPCRRIPMAFEVGVCWGIGTWPIVPSGLDLKHTCHYREHLVDALYPMPD